MKEFIRIDEDGYFIEPVILHTERDPETREYKYNITPDLISKKFENGMYKPRWTGTEWVDEITEDELIEKKKVSTQLRDQDFLDNPTENMILGRELMETTLNNILLEQQLELTRQQNIMLANLVIDMELHMLEREDNNG